MRIAVTGANGFLGGAIVRQARAMGHDVHALTRADGDLANLDGAARIAALAGRCDGTIHAAAMVDFAAKENWPFTVPNVVAPALIAEACARGGKRLAYVSAAVIAPGQQIDGTTSDRPNRGYIASKHLGEQAALGIHPGASALRIGGIFGANGPAHLGLNVAITQAQDGVVPKVNGTGTARRNYIYVEDCARIMVSALVDGWTGIHLVAGHEILSVRDMMTHVARQFLGRDPEHDPTANGGNDMIVVPSALLPPTRTLANALKDIAHTKAPA